MPLTDTKIRQTKATDKSIKITDGNGLHIEIRPNGSKLWRYRFKLKDADGNIKENTYAIGEYPEISLLDARRLRDEAREKVKQGINPSHARRTEKSSAIDMNNDSFERIAREWLEQHKIKVSDLYIKQITRTFELDVFPHIGKFGVRNINSHMILDVLTRMSKRGAESVALNAQQWISSVFRFAIVRLRADYDPVISVRGVVVKPPIKNSEAMTREDILELFKKLNKYGGMRTTYLSIRILLYSMLRTIEVRRGEWIEYDQDGALWTIPAHKMKKRRIHMIPLSRQLNDYLLELRDITGSNQYMVPNTRRPKTYMPATTVNRTLEYLGIPFTGHDFRATASTHLYEMGYAEHLVEMQLAHAETNKTKAAYNHAKYLNERREMLQFWADWLDRIEREALQPD